ncbi:MAG: right-handed parallel beta-helix repeat-containing protein [Planctomycetota bacterium]|nr:MAG: right-handed parallel beta-helix repeat-containing protein [Planctomycetota bacterium]
MKVRIFGCTITILVWSTLAQASSFFVSIEGTDTNPGTQARPFRTIQKAAEVMSPGDTCIIHAGIYYETVRSKVSGKKGEPIRFIAASGEKVVLKGTEPIQAEWEVYQDKIYRTKVDRNFIQLFVDEQMMVEARWPNMRFADDLWDRSKWAQVGKGSRYGKITDPELAKTGIDWTGARATLNVAHQFFSWTRTVARHTTGSDTFEYPRDLTGITHHADKTKTWEDDRYYLSGKLEALDSPGEWFLDTRSHTLYLWPLDGKNPTSFRVEVKTRNYAFEIRNLEYVEIAGFQFFGTTFLFDKCNHCLVVNCHLRYPTYARRIGDPAAQESWADRTLVAGAYNTVRKCSLAYSPTSGLVMTGPHNVAENNLIHDISWYGSLQHAPLRMSSNNNIKGTKGGIVRYNTVYNFGNAGICYRGQPYIIEYNHVYNGGLTCRDVALIYTGQPTCADSIVRYNWAHGCRTEDGKGLGIRGDDQTRRLTVHHNVVWDCGRDGIIVKGDYNKVYNNTVLNIGTKDKPGNYINLHTSPEPKKPWRKQHPLLERQNANSIILNNAALTITCHNKGTPFPPGENVSHNFQGPDLQLVDPDRLDFRPRKGSPLIDAGQKFPEFTDDFKGDGPDIGAYEFDGKYWKPGITWKP